MGSGHSDTSSIAFFRYPGDFGYKNPYSLAGGTPITFNLSQPGVVPDRQDAPHPHHVVVDPAGGFLVIPDLGADLLRFYYYLEQSGSTVTRIDPVGSVAAVPGSGPRHGVFFRPEPRRSVWEGGIQYLYTLNELSNTITGYRVSYVNKFPTPLPNVTRIFDISMHGLRGSVPKGTKAAEIQLSVRRLRFPFFQDKTGFNYLMVYKRSDSQY